MLGGPSPSRRHSGHFMYFPPLFPLLWRKNRPEFSELKSSAAASTVSQCHLTVRSGLGLGVRRVCSDYGASSLIRTLQGGWKRESGQWSKLEFRKINKSTCVLLSWRHLTVFPEVHHGAATGVRAWGSIAMGHSGSIQMWVCFALSAVSRTPSSSHCSYLQSIVTLLGWE